MNKRTVAHLAFLALMATTSQAGDIRIDPDFSPGGTTGPLPLPVTYQFMTSWDGIQWTGEQMTSTREGLAYLNGFFINQPAIKEFEGVENVTIRWAGADFFKNQGTWKLNGNDIDMDLTGALGVATKRGLVPPDGWDSDKYPLNEIYFNTQYQWSFSYWTNPLPGQYDFWSILQHEMIHMLCVNSHATNPNSVMYGTFSAGERRWTLTEEDKQMLRIAGYQIIPAPGSVALVALGCTAAWRGRRRSAA
jgi:hypothetical protein